MLAATGAGVGASAAVGLLVPMEAGVPIPVPADLLMLLVGERVADGQFPLWAAVVGFEAVALAAFASLLVLGALFWLLRRGRRRGGQAWTEASCPACLALSVVGERVSGLGRPAATS